MKITVDVSDFYMEDDKPLDEALTDFIKKEVIRSIWSVIQEQAKKLIEAEAKKVIDEELKTQISFEVARIVHEEGKITMNGKQVTLKEWIENEFQQRSAYRSPSDKIDKIAERLADELKKRYDSVFALGIVKRLTETGFINEEVAKKLLTFDNQKQP